MNGRRKSDRPIVPGKPSNKGPDASGSAERVEGRGLAKGNRLQLTRDRMLSRGALSSALERIRQAAKRVRERGGKLTALFHHVYSFERLREAYFGLNRQGAAGVDSETWAQFGEDLEVRLKDLSLRLRRGRTVPRR